MAQPWYTFPRIDNFGTIDPEGPYWKPDSNILTPNNYPVTALGSGVVTNVQQTSWGQGVVTVRLDKPLNSIATHSFYEHLGSVSVQQGQRVNFGSVLGTSGNVGQIPGPGFGFYNGDVYGSGPGWNQLQADLCPGCPNQLNPTAFLNSLKSGGSMSNVAPTGGGGTTSGGTAQGQSPFTAQTGGVTNAPAATACAPFDIACGLGNFWTLYLLPFFEHMVLFTVALILIIVGFFLLGGNKVIEQAGKGAAGTA